MAMRHDGIEAAERQQEIDPWRDAAPLELGAGAGGDDRQTPPVRPAQRFR